MSENFFEAAPIEETAPVEESVIPTLRRGRGRPKKNAEGGVTPPPVEGSQAPSKRKKRGVANDSEIEDRANALRAMHGTIGFFTGIPEFMLAHEEAMALAKANLNLEKEFDFELSGKTIAIAAMVGCMFKVYAPRVPAIFSRVKQAKEEKQKQQQGAQENANNG